MIVVWKPLWVSGAQVSVLSKNCYDSVDNTPKMLEAIRLKGASASG